MALRLWRQDSTSFSVQMCYSFLSAGLVTVFLALDQQGWITLLAGALFRGHDHVEFFWGATLQLNQQVGGSVLLASLTTLVIEAQLASRRRVRDSRDRADQLQARALRAGALVWLEPSPLHRRFLQLIATELADLAGGSPA
jgi:hypothetical protein